MVWMPGASRPIRPGWHWWGSGCSTLVTVKPVIQSRWMWQGGAAHRVLPHLAMVLTLLGYSPLVMVWGLMSMPSFFYTFISTWEPHLWWGLSWPQKLYGGSARGHVWGCPGPLVSTHCLVMAWVIIHWPSWRDTALALSWACLPTQLMALDSMNVALHALPRLSPSKDCLP